MNDYHTYDPFQLLALIKEDDQRAFKEMYERFFAQLYLQAQRRLRDREAAQDIVQDLFTHIWEKRKELEISVGVSAYLYTAVRNRVIDHLARLDRQQDHSVELRLLLNINPAATDRRVRERQLAEIIRSEIEQLPPQVRKVFELSRNGNLSHAEIGASLHISEQTVRGYVKSALRSLRVKFGGLSHLLSVLLSTLP